MNTDLIIIFKAVLTLYVVAALQLNQPHIFYYTVIISQTFATLLNSINEVLGCITNLSDLSDCALFEILDIKY